MSRTQGVSKKIGVDSHAKTATQVHDDLQGERPDCHKNRHQDWAETPSSIFVFGGIDKTMHADEQNALKRVEERAK